MDQSIQILRGLQIPAERLLDDEPCPSAAPMEAAAANLLDRGSKGLRRQRQIEHAIARKSMLRFERSDLVAEPLVEAAIVDARVAPPGRIAADGFVRQPPEAVIVHLRGAG